MSSVKKEALEWEPNLDEEGITAFEAGAAWQRERDALIADKHNGHTIGTCWSHIAHEIRGQSFDAVDVPEEKP